MISCARFDELHLASLETPLAPGLRAEFDGHLASCASCVERTKGYVATVEILQGLAGEEDLREAPPLPETLVQGLMAVRRAALDADRRGSASG